MDNYSTWTIADTTCTVLETARHVRRPRLHTRVRTDGERGGRWLRARTRAQVTGRWCARVWEPSGPLVPRSFRWTWKHNISPPAAAFPFSCPLIRTTHGFLGEEALGAYHVASVAPTDRCPPCPRPFPAARPQVHRIRTSRTPPSANADAPLPHPITVPQHLLQ